ncbi:outer membrane lipid asymmetry maintenance protein MlaD [Wolbachia endosymbiont of Pentidionis agamae]|uniref:outer membrane lipid asymmetry maintenance protein MlaD n=1 Tax=Wolbachia endosymbiont of Pentidionis agamae TaxID=3110435 RepID=UPI002FCF2E78
MLKANILEVIIGLIVLILTIFLGLFAFDKLLHTRNYNKNFYKIHGFFSNVNGLSINDVVKVSGVEIGSVSSITINGVTYMVRVDMNIDSSIKLPIDSAASIVSSSLISGKFINISPGSESKFISNGGKLEHTQSEISIGGIIDRVIGTLGKR